MSLSPESNYRIAQLRSKLLSGQELSQEELRESITLMREARGQAAAASATKSRTAKPKVNSDSLLNELEGL